MKLKTCSFISTSIFCYEFIPRKINFIGIMRGGTVSRVTLLITIEN